MRPLWMDFLEAAAALPAELYLLCLLPRVHTFLERLVHGPAEVATLRKLTLPVPAISATTLSLLSGLTGLTDLTLVLDEPVFESWPCLPRLQALHVRYRAQDDCEDWGPCLLTALAAGPTRLDSLEVLHLGRVWWTPAMDAGVAAAAPRLMALSRLTIYGVEWTFVRGAIAGRSPPSGGR